MTTLNKHKLFTDVFAPAEQDTVLVMVDAPHDTIQDNADWQERRTMAEEWRIAFQKFPVRVHPLLSYPATSANNGDLPRTGNMSGREVVLEDVISNSTIIIAMTRYSATAPLAIMARKYPSIRVASMPGVLRRMEETALAADYTEVARKVHILTDLLTRADGADIVFTTGDRAYFDLRYRAARSDDGICHPDKSGTLINLPSGEAFIVPYEGEREDDYSMTRGIIPVQHKGETFQLLIESNRIADVRGEGPEARAFRQHLDQDPARRNVAELGLGCNDKAVVSGSVIEDEKAGLHWAYGRSEHLGGVTGPASFLSPKNVVHQDIVYAPDSPIGVTRLTLHFPDGDAQDIIMDNAYCVFDR